MILYPLKRMMRRGGGLLIFINGKGIVLNYVDATRLAQAEIFFPKPIFQQHEGIL